MNVVVQRWLLATRLTAAVCMSYGTVLEELQGRVEEWYRSSEAGMTPGRGGLMALLVVRLGSGDRNAVVTLSHAHTCCMVLSAVDAVVDATNCGEEALARPWLADQPRNRRKTARRPPSATAIAARQCVVS